MPTARIYLPAGTYTDSINAGSQTVPALTAGSIAQVDPEAGDTLTVTGSNAPAEIATYLWQFRATPGTGEWGAASGTNDAAAYVNAQEGEYRRGVSLPAAAMVYTDGVTVGEAAAAPLTWTRIFTGSQNSATPSFTMDLSAYGAGDKILIFEGAESSTVVFNSLQGEAGSAEIATSAGSTTGRKLYIFEHTLTGAGSASAVLSLTSSGDTHHAVDVFGIKNGVRDGQKCVTSEDTGFPNFSETPNLAPSGATNVVFATVIGRNFSSMGHTFTNMQNLTDFAPTASVRVDSAYQENVAVATFTPTGAPDGATTDRKGGAMVIYSQA